MDKLMRNIQECLEIEINEKVSLKKIRQAMNDGKIWKDDNNDGVIAFPILTTQGKWFVIVDCLGRSGNITVEAQGRKKLDSIILSRVKELLKNLPKGRRQRTP